MPEKFIPPFDPRDKVRLRLSFGQGDDRVGLDTFNEHNTNPFMADAYFDADGPALRDALLEAFPLPEKIDRLVPGMVLRWGTTDEHYVVLPDDRIYSLQGHDVSSGWTSARLTRNTTVVFDPRDAVALPSPLGIRVGDRVERTKDGITISFEVGHIGDGTKHLFAKGDSPNFPVAYNPKGFTVTSREVPDRLPAGTIVREKRSGDLYLRTADSWISLTEGHVPTHGHDALEYDVEHGHHEVIYLPES